MPSAANGQAPTAAKTGSFGPTLSPQMTVPGLWSAAGGSTPTSAHSAPPIGYSGRGVALSSPSISSRSPSLSPSTSMNLQGLQTGPVYGGHPSDMMGSPHTTHIEHQDDHDRLL
ncbi:hypothetical protein BC831DRAFT_473915 [Entophlyctis helioformis]|nr:hypothetical protein BC831DRAFT_473915 [Entophlyctis helioformis]